MTYDKSYYFLYKSYYHILFLSWDMKTAYFSNWGENNRCQRTLKSKMKKMKGWILKMFVICSFVIGTRSILRYTL